MHDEVWALEQRLWRDGPAAFEELLADEVLMVLPMPGPAMDRAAVLASLDGAARWDRIETAEPQHMQIGPGTLLLTYLAKAEREGAAYQAGTASLWRRTGAGWRLAFHQQTPD